MLIRLSTVYNLSGCHEHYWLRPFMYTYTTYIYMYIYIYIYMNLTIIDNAIDKENTIVYIYIYVWVN